MCGPEWISPWGCTGCVFEPKLCYFVGINVHWQSVTFAYNLTHVHMRWRVFEYLSVVDLCHMSPSLSIAEAHPWEMCSSQCRSAGCVKHSLIPLVATCQADWDAVKQWFMIYNQYSFIHRKTQSCKVFKSWCRCLLFWDSGCTGVNCQGVAATATPLASLTVGKCNWLTQMGQQLNSLSKW